MYPSNQDYKLAVMIGADSFRTLEDIEILPNPLYPTEPWFATGGLAIVFKVKYQGKLFALKCFTKESAERQDRLLAISDYLKQSPNPYFVDFTYLENELWVESENGGEGYSVVLMEWVEGLTLDNYLKKVCANEDKPTLKRLYDNFGRLILWIQAQPIAHGDLKHDNILVTPDGQLKLIDYDGMYIPAFLGLKATELGSPCYQHPLRTAEYFNENLDDFSLLILQITLLAFETEPYLFFENFNGDGLLFKDNHMRDFENSKLKKKLMGLPNAFLQVLCVLVEQNNLKFDKIDLPPYWALINKKTKKPFLEPLWLTQIIYLYSDSILRTLTEFYPFKSIEIIEKYREKWDWGVLCWNRHLPWDEEFLEKYIDNWNWDELSSSPNINWTLEIIEKYKSLWNWQELSGNEGLPWSVELIEKYIKLWNWKELSRNESLPWDEEFLEKYIYSWNWEKLSRNESLPWSIEFIQIYKGNWHRNYLSMNKGLPWTENLIENFKENWNYKFLSGHKNLPWTIDFIDKYSEKWDWYSLSMNQNLPWTVEFIERFENKWSWESLSWNESLPWSFELIVKYEGRWNWNKLSKNKSIPFTLSYIEKYSEKWDWIELGLQKNIKWTEGFLEKFKEKWLSDDLYMKNYPSTPIELIERFKQKCSWRESNWNPNISLSRSFIESLDKLDLNVFNNKNFIEFLIMKINHEKLDEYMENYRNNIDS